MNEQDKIQSASPLGLGVITIFMVLIVMCLSILATLALSTARGDLHLSQINAETVSAYYRADAEAAELYDRFAAGTEEFMYETIPMTETQLLYVSFGRDSAGQPVILAWQTMSSLDESEWGDSLLPVWQGD